MHQQFCGYSSILTKQEENIKKNIKLALKNKICYRYIKIYLIKNIV